MPNATRANWARLMALPLALGLSGCLSLSGDVPDSLLELTPQRAVQAGTARSGNLAQAIAVVDPETPAKLDVLRVPVQSNATEITYLKDAVWVEKPARQFSRLLAETIRAGGTRLVLDATEGRFQASTRLTGQLLDLGYDAASQSVIVRYDAVLTRSDGSISNRRFESRVPGISAEAGAVGPALNQAANDVAAQVADWVG
ncbi:MAG: ABC-type transport auxiliary lipoprotein family protein [Novosphingobium sp.]